MNVTMEDLIYKIGLMTVETDALRAENKELGEQVAELQKQLADERTAKEGKADGSSH